MTRPVCLDLYCGAGGASMGLYRAGFDVVGVDIKPQPHYPAFHDAEYAKHFRFIQADAMTFPLEGYDCYWASPPCQGYSIMRNLPWNKDRKYPLLIEPTRQRLLDTLKPFILENVMGAHLQAGYLCGMMFGLGCYNHRAFETPFFWLQPGHPKHNIVFKSGNMFGNNGGRRTLVSGKFGIGWMNREERSNAIPPAYSEYLGKYLMAAVAALAGKRE